MWWDSLGQLVRVSADGSTAEVLEGRHGVGSVVSRHPEKPWIRAIYQELNLKPGNSNLGDDSALDNEENLNFGNLVTKRGRFQLRKIEESKDELVLDALGEFDETANIPHESEGEIHNAGVREVAQNAIRFVIRKNTQFGRGGEASICGVIDSRDFIESVLGLENLNGQTQIVCKLGKYSVAERFLKISGGRKQDDVANK